MRETAPYHLVSYCDDDDGVAGKEQSVPALAGADGASSDLVFALLASQPDVLAESSRVATNTPDPFDPEETGGQQPISQEDADPLPKLGNIAQGAEDIRNTASADIGKNTPQNLAGAYAGAGQGPGGVSTPNPSGGGAANLQLPSQTQLQQMMAGGNAASSSVNPNPVSVVPSSGPPPASHSAPNPSPHPVSAGTSSKHSTVRPDDLTMGLGGAGEQFDAYEGGIAGGVPYPAVSPLVQGVAGTTLSNVPVALFTDGNPGGTAGEFTATINWGDNTPTTSGTITALPGGYFGVSGTHTYQTSGTYSVQVQIDDYASVGVSTATSTAVISDAPLTATAASITATENVAANNVTVASFTTTNPYAAATSFTASIDWGDGTSASAVTISGSGGSFNVSSSHTYTEGGTYQVSVTITSSGGSSAAVASTATVADPPLTGTGVTLTPNVTGSDTTLAATFTDANTSEDPSNYLAQIDWGDGWTDDAAVSGSNGSYSLSGSHAYDHPGTYTVTVTVDDAGGSTLTQTATAAISAAALSASGATLTATAGQALSNAQIASFTDGNTDNMNDWYGPTTGYSATIDWGDGTGLDSSAVITGDENGFYVLGNHTYSTAGAYTATVTITNADGVTASTTSTIDVTTITPTGSSFNASEGVAANNVTGATFTDTQSDTYTATIDWGDGSAPTAGVVSGSNGSYTVSGSYTYTDGGTYPVTVTITNSEGLSIVTTGTANVADAPLTATPQNATTPANTAANTLTLATFTDANPNDSISSYSASIDWGDGNPTDVGTISYANGVYTVSGSHNYASAGSYTATVTISDDGGATATASPTVTVTAPVINATEEDLSAQEDVPLTNVTVATFTAPGQASDYTATVDWGDGNTSSGTISGSSGSFTVVASNTYEEQTGGQQFLVTVTISDSSGDSTTVYSTATVDGGTLSATGASLSATEETASTFTLATFTDTDASYSADEYDATVDWGDGNQDVATVIGSNGAFSVQDTHAYAEEGSYTATVTITDPNGITTQTLSDAVTVADAALTATAPSYNITASAGSALNGMTVALFTDGNPYELASAYTATINWGDGSGDTTGYVNGGGGSFSVSGSHTYAAAGTYTLTVTISDPGGSQATLSYSETVAPTVTYTVATFMDPNSGDPASAFSASINWGDGTATSGTITGGNGFFTVTGSHAYAEAQTQAYSVSVTISGPGGPITVQSTASVTDAAFSGSLEPPAPPQALPPQAEVASIKLDFGNAKMNKIAAAQPGLRIHVDDDFSLRFRDPFDQLNLMANYRLSAVRPGFDSNLAPGTVTIGPAGSLGTLVWTIPNSVRVWWQPVQNGPWELVKSGGKPNDPLYKAIGQPIPILIQGLAPEGGPNANILVEYKMIGQKTPVSASIFYNVYTGLKVNGASDPQAQFVSQISSASGYDFATDGNGNVWRKSEPALMAITEVYKGTFASYLSSILKNVQYASYAKANPTTVITAVATPDLTPWFFDSHDLKSIYPNNIAAATAPTQLGNDGNKVAAAIIIHALTEQYKTQVMGLAFQVKFADLEWDHDAGGAVGEAITAEEAVLSWGNRKTLPPSIPITFGNETIQLVG